MTIMGHPRESSFSRYRGVWKYGLDPSSIYACLRYYWSLCMLYVLSQISFEHSHFDQDLYFKMFSINKRGEVYSF